MSVFKSPFKFLDSYTLADRDVFFGRDQEIAELYRRVFESKILLVYGVSGTGKSSLINCGLASRFDESDWLPLYIRRGSNIIDSLNKAINKQALTPLKKSQSVADKLQSIYLDNFKPIYLLFDQFEEIFIFGNQEERSGFIKLIKEITDSKIQCRIIFILREEFLAGMTDFRSELPNIFENCFRVEKMKSTNAISAVEGPCRVNDIETEAGFPEELIDKLCPSGIEIELTYLQIYLDRIFRIAEAGENEDKKLKFSKELLTKAGSVSDLLGQFLEEQIREFEDPDTGMSILKSFVSIQGTRRQMNESGIKEAVKAFGIEISEPYLTKYLTKFVDLRILRERDEAGHYELRHDALAAKIFEKITLVEKEILEIRQFIENAYANWQKRRVLLSTDDLDYISPYESRLYLSKDFSDFIEISKKELVRSRRRLRIFILTGVIFLFLILSGFTFWAIVERNNSKIQANIAKSNYYYALSKELKQSDPTIALVQATEAFKLNPSENNHQNLIDIYSNNEFYIPVNLKNAGEEKITGIAFIKNGICAIVQERRISLLRSKDDIISQWNFKEEFSDYDISSDHKKCLVYGDDDTLRIYDINNKELFKERFKGKFYTSNYIIARFLYNSDKFYVKTRDGISIFQLDGEMIAHSIDPNINNPISTILNSDSANTLNIQFDNFLYTWLIDKNYIIKNTLKCSDKNQIYNHTAIKFPNDEIAVISSDQAVQIFDNHGKLIRSIKLNEWISKILYINKDYFLTIGENALTIWDLNGNEIKTLLLNNADQCSDNIYYDPSNDLIVFLIGGSIYSWKLDLNTSEIIFSHETSIDNYLIKALDENTLEVDSINGTYLGTIKSENNKRRWISKSYKLYGVSDPGKTTAEIFNINGLKLCTIDLIYHPIYLLEFSPNDQLFVTVGIGGGTDNFFDLWNTKGKKLKSISDHGANIYKLLFSSDNKNIISLSDDNLAIVWDTTGEKICQLYHPNYIVSADISMGGKYIITGCSDGFARLWSIDGKLIGSFGNQSYNANIEVTFNSDGSDFLIYDGKSTKIYDIKGSLQNIFTSSNSGVLFSKNKGEVYVVDSEKRVRKLRLKETLDNFLIGDRLYHLSVKEKLNFNFTSFKDVLKYSTSQDLFDAGNYYLEQALKIFEKNLRMQYFQNAEKLLLKGTILDSHPVRFLCQLNDLYIKESMYTGENYTTKLDNIFNKIIETNNYYDLRFAALYYYQNSNGSTFKYNFPRKAVELTKKFIKLYPEKSNYLFHENNRFAFILVKSKIYNEALEFAILNQKYLPDGVYANTYLPLCYLMNDSVETAKKLYLNWKDKSLPDNWATKRQSTYGDFFRSDLRAMQNSGIKIPEYEKIMILLGGTIK
jgi:WD40 repeat protein